MLRVADLCGHLGLPLAPRTLEKSRFNEDDHYQKLEDYPLFMHRAAARATRAHRAGDTAVLSEQLHKIVALAATLSRILYGWRELGRAVEAKMDKNRLRPHKHGRPY